MLLAGPLYLPPRQPAYLCEETGDWDSGSPNKGVTCLQVACEHAQRAEEALAQSCWRQCLPLLLLARPADKSCLSLSCLHLTSNDANLASSKAKKKKKPTMVPWFLQMTVKYTHKTLSP